MKKTIFATFGLAAVLSAAPAMAYDGLHLELIRK